MLGHQAPLYLHLLVSVYGFSLYVWTGTEYIVLSCRARVQRTRHVNTTCVTA